MISAYWKDVLTKILKILGILIVYKLLTFAILPGVKIDVVSQMTSSVDSITNLLFSGGISKYSLMAVGIQPYISATMIMQMLTSSIGFDSFKKLKNEQGGNLIIGEYVQYLTLFIAGLQGLYTAHTLYYYEFISKGPVVYMSWFWFYLITTICIMTGSMIVLWISNLISSFNLGSGTSFIICANLLNGDNIVYELYKLFMANKISGSMILLIIGIFVFISFVSIAVENAKAKVAVCYPNVEYKSEDVSVNRYIPLKINNSGIMPLVMCSCIFQVLNLFFNILDKLGWYTHHIKYYVLKLSNTSSAVHYIFYSIMLLFFTYKYTEMSFDSNEISKNLYVSGVIVDGVRPMTSTRDYLQKRINALNLLTFIILLLIVLLPTFLSHYINNSIGRNLIHFGNSSLVILISTLENIMESIRKNVYNFYNIISTYMIK